MKLMCEYRCVPVHQSRKHKRDLVYIDTDAHTQHAHSNICHIRRIGGVYSWLVGCGVVNSLDFNFHAKFSQSITPRSPVCDDDDDGDDGKQIVGVCCVVYDELNNSIKYATVL